MSGSTTPVTVLHDERHVCMAPGQSSLVQLPAGACLHVGRGRLSLQEPPRWLSQTVHAPVRLLAAGQVHVMARRGWLRIDALAACELVWRVPRPAPRPSWPLPLLSLLR